MNTAFLNSGLHGLERENLRLDQNGHLSQRSHLEALGVLPTNSNYTLDFAECQLELVTPPFATIPALMDYLQHSTELLTQKLGTEHLWPHSMPPHCSLSEIKIAQFGEDAESKKKYLYRKGLCHRYGKMMQTICGIHYNRSFDPALFASLGLSQNEAYFKIIRNFYQFYPLLIYLFGASPFCYANSRKAHLDDSRFLTPSGDLYIGKAATSLRQSELGYHNPPAEFNVCYNSLESYLRFLKRATSTVYEPYTHIPAHEQLNAYYLQQEGEYYAPIRPKPAPHIKLRPIEALEQGGIHYIEVRCLDLNPLLPLGIDASTLAFVDLFLLYCLIAKEGKLDCATCKEKALTIAKFGQDNPSIIEEGLMILKAMEPYATDTLHADALALQYEKLKDPHQLPSSQILTRLKA